MVFNDNGKSMIIKAGDVAKYCDEYFFSCLERWALTKMWGLAHGQGWANEPVEYINAISVLENEQNMMEGEQIEATKAKAKPTASSDRKK